MRPIRPIGFAGLAILAVCCTGVALLTPPRTPQVQNVTAFQRDDISRLVVIDYSLTPAGYDYEIEFQVSDDGGGSWWPDPESQQQPAAWGDCGPGIVHGDNKRIVWNPAVDAIRGDNCKVKVIVAGGNSEEFGPFTINPCPPEDPDEGVLFGTVRDRDTGDGIELATVTVPNELPTTTGTDGSYAFYGVEAGGVPVQATKTGLYYDVAKTVVIRGNSSTSADLLMTPALPKRAYSVVEVRGKYSGPGQRVYYLDDVSLSETFTATVDWGTTPPGNKEVRWKTTSNQYDDPCPGTTVSRIFNMDDEFSVGGVLEVWAVGDGTPQAEPYVANFLVISPPPGVFANLLYAVPFTNHTLKYVTPNLGLEAPETGDGVDDGTIPDDKPLFGSKAFKFLKMFDFSAEVNGDGSAEGMSIEIELPGGGEGETKLAGYEFGASGGGQVLWQYDEYRGPYPGQWLPGGYVWIGASASAAVPPSPITFFIGPVPCYFRGSIDVGVSVGLEVSGWTVDPLNPGNWDADWQGTLNLDPFPYAEAALGAGAADVCAVEGYLGGGARMTLGYPYTPPNPVEELQIFLAGGVRVILWIITYEWPLFERSWDIYGKGLRSTDLGEPTEKKVMPRDYLDPSATYADFVANDYEILPDSLPEGVFTQEIPLQIQIFGQSAPELATAGINPKDLMAVWIYDDDYPYPAGDPDRSPLNRTEVVYSLHNSALLQWSAPVPVDDDGTADFHPQLASLPGGNALLVWENMAGTMVEPGEPCDPCNALCQDDPDPARCRMDCKLDELKGKAEISVARYNAGKGSWGSQTILTSNGYLDRSPRIATAGDSTAVVTWVGNEQNHEMGSSSSPNTIYYCTYDGSSWSSTKQVSTSVNSVIKSDLAYSGTKAALVFTGDTDDNTATPGDRELYAVEATRTGEVWTWGSVTLLKDDSSAPVQDANPQVFYDSGIPRVVWYRDGNLHMADLNTASVPPLQNEEIIVDRGGGGSTGAADFRLAQGSQGEIALVWQDASAERVDMWHSYYDPGKQQWSRPQQLTRDDSMEHSMAPLFWPAVAPLRDDLLVIYDKVQTEYQSRTVDVSGQPVTIHNVPKFTQTDLYLLGHLVHMDLAVFEQDTSVSPSKPVAGETATISAWVRNLGDLPASNITVRFYDGDPESGGQQISGVTLAVLPDPPLLGGDQILAESDPWVVPTEWASELYVKVEVGSPQQDDNSANDTAMVSQLAQPDLVIESVMVQAAGPHRVFTVRVANHGLQTATDANIDVDLRRDPADSGSSLFAPPYQPVAGPIEPGAYRDLSWAWQNVLPEPSGSVEIHALVDPDNQIGESDESNNVRPVLVVFSEGACCQELTPGDWSCQETTQAECIGVLSYFKGIGSICDGVDDNLNDIPDVCEDTPGACCEDGGRICTDRTYAECQQRAGEFMGFGTTCTAESGACCAGDGSCAELERTCCEVPGDQFQDDGTACMGDENGNAIDDFCEGACCHDADGTCTDERDQATCEGLPDEQTWLDYWVICGEDYGACCFADGSCRNMDSVCCENEGGEFQGNGVLCLGDGLGGSIDDACVGACCHDDKSCTIEVSTDCTDPSQFRGNATFCVPEGACCLPNGTCMEGVAEECCDEAAGYFLGAGTNCSGGPSGPSGACCCLSGWCQEMNQACCDEANGDFLGVDTQCAGDNNGDGKDDACGCLCGDVNQSGGPVDLNDFAGFALCFGFSQTGPSCPAEAFDCSDMDGDGQVDLNDFATFANLYGLESTQRVPYCGL